ncbi:hypothetical protein PFISCL1PPCAC_21530, partial [Pristionchus fissidentatus]
MEEHAGHFGYDELFANEVQVGKEMARMRVFHKFLMKEKEEIDTKKKQINNLILAASNEIASKCTFIIAQAISRCLDLTAQVQKVGRSRNEMVERREETIVQTLDRMKMAMDTMAKIPYTRLLLTRLNMQKS